MSKMILLGAAFVFAGSSAGAAELTETWRATGFDLPELVSWDAGANAFYVSNLGTDPMSKDGDGFISKLDADGKVAIQKWVTGLDAPKGTEVVGDKLYVADIDRLVEIDIAAGKIVNSYPAAGAKFLNDLAVATDGRVFIADTMANSIYLLENGKITEWLNDPALNGPNGLTIIGSDLVVASLGDISGGFEKMKPGGVLKIDLVSKAISPFGDGSSPGNLDGIEPDGTGGVVVTANGQGLLLDVKPGQAAVELAKLKPGAADLEYIPTAGLYVIPQMQEGEVVGFVRPPNEG